jgi:hypothetical protein
MFDRVRQTVYRQGDGATLEKFDGCINCSGNIDFANSDCFVWAAQADS